MDRTDAIAWVVSVCTGLLRASQVHTLADIVGSTLATTRLSLAGIGRQMAADRDGSAKHAIKRVWRFIANPHVEPVEVMPPLFTRLWRRWLRWHGKRQDRRPLLVSLDWTKVRSFHVLMAAVIMEGRALPFCWASYKDRVQGKSQNALEEAMLLRIKAALPPEVRMVVLADRGFGRASLVQTCQRWGLDYLVRISADVIVKTRRWSGNLQHYPIRKGQCHSFIDAQYRSDGLVNTNLIVRWKKGLAPQKDQPWHLLTSLPVGGKARDQRLSDLYALRFAIEELFRDAKNEHLGWSLSKTRITRADRLDRPILVAALAYLLLVALGLWRRVHRDPRQWCTNRRRHELSAFAIARVMLHRTRVAMATFIPLLMAQRATTEGKWG